LADFSTWDRQVSIDRIQAALENQVLNINNRLPDEENGPYKFDVRFSVHGLQKCHWHFSLAVYAEEGAYSL
jgi:hypothetical protein